MNKEPGKGRVQPPYLAFLVRCWREGKRRRILLENVVTRDRKGFDNLETFLETLRKQLSDDEA